MQKGLGFRVTLTPTCHVNSEPEKGQRLMFISDKALSHMQNVRMSMPSARPFLTLLRLRVCAYVQGSKYEPVM